MNQQQRSEVLDKFKVDVQFLCDRCLLPIIGAPYIDVLGGYFPKPAHLPDFLPKQPKKTYDKTCDQIRRGKLPDSAKPIVTYHSKPSLQAQQTIIKQDLYPKLPIKRLSLKSHSK